MPNTNKQLYIQSYRSTFSNFFRISTTSLSEKFKQQSPRLYCMLSPEILYKFQMPRRIHNLSAEILTPKRVKKIPVLSVNCSFVGNSESFAPYHAPVNFRHWCKWRSWMIIMYLFFDSCVFVYSVFMLYSIRVCLYVFNTFSPSTFWNWRTNPNPSVSIFRDGSSIYCCAILQAIVLRSLSWSIACTALWKYIIKIEMNRRLL